MKDSFLGTVANYKKNRGFGHIKPDNTSKLGNKVSCHWKTIKSSDKWPTLVNGMRVSFKVAKDEKKVGGWKTTEVYTEDRKEINMKKKVILFKNGEKYRGVCTNWNRGKGEGLIKPHEDGPWLKAGVKVQRSDIDSDAGTATLKQGQQVQFQVKKEKSGYRAVNVILPGVENVATQGVSEKKTKEDPEKSPLKKSPLKKSETKQTRKRQLSPTNNKTEKKTEKKIKLGAKKDMKHAELESGIYGGMEVSVADVIEVGILIKSQWVGSLIGKKGATIREIKKFSQANMQFGDDEIPAEGGLYKVFAISGTMNQVADACKLVAVKMGEASQVLEYKIVFLVPDSHCGIFVGKKGSTINEIRGEVDLRVRVILSQEPLLLPGANKVTICSVFGPRENLKDAIERTVAVLGGISARIRKQTEEPPQWGNEQGGAYGGNIQDMGWGQGRGRGAFARSPVGRWSTATVNWGQAQASWNADRRR